LKILSASQMREVDRLTIEHGIPGLILMENAASRLVDFLLEAVPLASRRVLVVCGKGNNGGDGFAIARQLFTRRLCRELTVVELFDPASLSGDAAANRHMLDACGCPVGHEFPSCPTADLVLDAILGTGLSGSVKEGAALEAIRRINHDYAHAQVVAVDIPSGLPSDVSRPSGEFVKAGYTVTFTAPKPAHCLSPIYEHVGKLRVVPIGSPPELYEKNPDCRTNLATPHDIRLLFAPRPCDSNKGLYGHVLVVGGSFGKSGAPAMTGVAAYRSGAGLVTVSVPESVLTAVAAVRPELMTEPLPDAAKLLESAKKMTVLAVGPGLGTAPETVGLVRTLYQEAEIPAVFDADGLNALAGDLPTTEKIRILTPHPGEMSRLTGKSTKEVQADRVGAAKRLAAESGATIVLKGDRTVIAFPDGEIWINPTGSPSMATGGTGDILTGMISGLVAQHPKEWRRAVIAAVWLHGRCGELGGAVWGEQAMLATDLLDQLPKAMNELRPAL
jgi:hydroxyethylthiazole kinase-like uncharacterized protein yjeF